MAAHQLVTYSFDKEYTSKFWYNKLYSVMYKGLEMDWFDLKHVAKAYEREYKLRFD